MGKNLNEFICKMVKDHDNDRITVITEKLKIKGTVPPENEKNPDCVITLNNVEIYKLKEKCDKDECDYMPEPMATFPFLNISSLHILGFGYCGCGNTDNM